MAKANKAPAKKHKAKLVKQVMQAAQTLKAQAQAKAQAKAQAQAQAQANAEAQANASAAQEQVMTQQTAALPFATITNANGQQIQLDAAQFGAYVKSNYTTMDFIFKNDFYEYMDAHVMKNVREKLLSGMDEVSVDYVHTFERMLAYVRNADNALVQQNTFWTNTDRALFERNAQWVAKGEPAFLRQVNLEWSSSYTNIYGMYDVLPMMTKVKKEDLAVDVAIEADEDGMIEVNYQDRFNGKAIIDVGGYIGDTVLLFRDLFSKSTIYAFEPQTGNYNSMVQTLAADVQSGRLVPVQMGLGDKKATMRISGFQGKVDAAASVTKDYGIEELSEEVQIVAFDSYVKEHKLNVGLIKVDVEGFEPEIIKGSLKTIKEQRPLLVIAIYHNGKEFYELKSYIEKLNLGYKFCIRRSTLGNPCCDLVLIAYPD